MVVAANIRAESARLGITQQEIANALGITQGGVSKKWRGRVAWSLADLETMTRVLDCSLATLMSDGSVARRQSARLEGLEPPTF